MSARGFACTLLAWMSSPGLFLMGWASFLVGESPLQAGEKKDGDEIMNAGLGLSRGKLASVVERARTRSCPCGFGSWAPALWWWCPWARRQPAAERSRWWRHAWQSVAAACLQERGEESVIKTHCSLLLWSEWRFTRPLAVRLPKTFKAGGGKRRTPGKLFFKLPFLSFKLKFRA